MEVFYNELSNQPLAGCNTDARDRIIALLTTLKGLREHYEVNVMRAHHHFYTQQMGPDYLISDFLYDSSVGRTLRELLATLVAYPYIADDDSLEAEMFVMNEFSTLDHTESPVCPEGLAAAFVFDAPVVSMQSGEYWQKETLELFVKESSGAVECHTLLNVHSVACFSTDSFQSWWAALHPPVPLDCKENICKVFPEHRFRFEKRAVDDIISWFYDDKRYLNKVKDLIEDIVSHPFAGGKGHTETLSYEAGKASKRIVKKDRLVYTYTDTLITIHQCKGHYEDR